MWPFLPIGIGATQLYNHVIDLLVGMSSSIQRTPYSYSGFQRKLIIAFDVGTTFSGVSYVLLIPGEPSVIQGVTRLVATIA